jgi:hypothetical protein
MRSSRETRMAFAVAFLLFLSVAGAAEGRSLVLTDPPPANTLRPVLSGIARNRETLTTRTGSWTGTPPITFTYQWVRCDATGANCAAIASAIAQTYTLASADVGHELYARVTATNSGGAATIRTYLSRAVAPAAQVNTNLGSALPAALPPSSGATFYVSTAGSDSNPGTLAAPWRTIQHALDTLQSGQTAFVRAGTYGEDLYGTYGEDLYFSRAGTELDRYCRW